MATLIASLSGRGLHPWVRAVHREAPLPWGVDMAQHRLIFAVVCRRSLLLRAAANLDESCVRLPGSHYPPEPIRTKLDNPKQARPGLGCI